MVLRVWHAAEFIDPHRWLELKPAFENLCSSHVIDQSAEHKHSLALLFFNQQEITSLWNQWQLAASLRCDNTPLFNTLNWHVSVYSFITIQFFSLQSGTVYFLQLLIEVHVKPQSLSKDAGCSQGELTDFSVSAAIHAVPCFPLDHQGYPGFPAFHMIIHTHIWC